MLGGSSFLNPPVRGWLSSPTPPPGFPSPSPEYFRIESPSHLVIGYHCLAFLNQVLKVHNSLGILSTKSTISQKLKIVKIEKLSFSIGFRTSRNFLIQKPNLATFKREGEGGLHVVNQDRAGNIREWLREGKTGTVESKR